MSGKLESIISKKVTDMANYTVKNTVGKSLPLLVHEVKLPESVRKEFLEKDVK